MKNLTWKEKWAAWARGDLSYLLRPHGQTWVYNFIKGLKTSGTPAVVNCHRRLGKSTLGLIILLEYCLKNPGAICKYGAPTEKQVVDIVMPNLDVLISECPPEFRPKQSGDKYYIKNPVWDDPDAKSILQVVGVDFRKGDLLRGAAADKVILDEARDMQNLDYLVKDVLIYQFLGRPEPLIMIPTTPPKVSAHDLTIPGGYFDMAKRKGRYFEISGDDNPDATIRDRELVLDVVGSVESTSWKREWLVQIVNEESEMVLPDFPKYKNLVVVDSYNTPTHFQPWVCMDAGWEDNCAVLFAYVDWLNQKLVVQDMFLTHYRTTGEISEMIKAYELKLWKNNPLKPIRVADCTPQQLDDLCRDKGIWFEPVEKHDSFAAIARLRSGIQTGRIAMLKEACEPLIYQCENALFNEQRTDFARNEILGHCDALVALKYLYRMVVWGDNPFPDQKYDPATHWVPRFQPDRARGNMTEIFGLNVLDNVSVKKYRPIFPLLKEDHDER